MHIKPCKRCGNYDKNKFKCLERYWFSDEHKTQPYATQYGLICSVCGFKARRSEKHPINTYDSETTYLIALDAWNRSMKPWWKFW